MEVYWIVGATVAAMVFVTVCAVLALVMGG